MLKKEKTLISKRMHKMNNKYFTLQNSMYFFSHHKWAKLKIWYENMHVYEHSCINLFCNLVSTRKKDLNPRRHCS